MTTLRTSLTIGFLAAVLLTTTAVVARADDAGRPLRTTSLPGTVGGPGAAPAPEPGSASIGTVDARPPATDLDPGLVAAFDRARRAAADDGHHLVINSGFRTAERQQELLDEEVTKRGSYEEATRWVFPPDRSMHVQGLAIDVGDGGAADWLAANGAAFGLCHTLSWEWWHVEWRARWQASATCPAPAQDPSAAPGL